MADLSTGSFRIVQLCMSILLWSSFGLAVAGLSTRWIGYGTSMEEGLWTARDKTVESSDVGIERLPWINATTSFMIIGTVFTWLAAFGLNVITGHYAKLSKYLQYASACSCTGAWSLVIACAVYTAHVEQGYAGSGNPLDATAATYTVGFIVSWVAAGCGVVGSTMFWMTVEKLKE